MSFMELNRNFLIYLVLLHCLIIAVSNYLVQFPIVVFGLDYTIGTFTFPIIVWQPTLQCAYLVQVMQEKL